MYDNSKLLSHIVPAGINIAIKIESIRVRKAVIRIPVVASKSIYVCGSLYVSKICVFMWERCSLCVGVCLFCFACVANCYCYCKMNLKKESSA